MKMFVTDQVPSEGRHNLQQFSKTFIEFKTRSGKFSVVSRHRADIFTPAPLYCAIAGIDRYHANVADSFQTGSVTIGGGQLFLIAGPCVIESEKHALLMAEAISSIARKKRVQYIFKASYDKAN